MTDQALHDTSNGLREQASHDDDIGILLSCLCSFISLEMLWAQLEKLCGTIMLKTSLYKLVCASKERLTKVFLEQGITTKVISGTKWFNLITCSHVLLLLVTTTIFIRCCCA